MSLLPTAVMPVATLCKTGRRFRYADFEDLDQMTDLWVSTAQHKKDPTAPYRFPGVDKFSGKHYDIFRRLALYKNYQYLETCNVLAFEEVSSEGDAKIIGMAVSKLMIPPSSSGLPRDPVAQSPPGFKIPTRPSKEETDQIANKSRCTAFEHKAGDTREKLFDNVYPDGYVFIKVLYVAEGRQRQGIGTVLLLQALREARSIAGRPLPAALFASSCGKPLYEKVGFEEVGRLKAKATENDKEVLDVACMAIAADKVEGLCSPTARCWDSLSEGARRLLSVVTFGR